MAKRMRKKRHNFLRFLLIYAFVFFTVIAIGMRFLQTYLEDYEATRSSTFLAKYMDSIDNSVICDLASDFVATLDPNIKTVKESNAVITAELSDGLTVSKKVAESTDSRLVYAFMNNDRAVGELVLLRADQADSMGLYPWSVESAEISMPELLQSYSVTVPKDWSVICNGYGLDGNYVTATGIHYDFLEDYYADYEDLPTKVSYYVTGYIGDLDVVLLDSEGNEATIDPEQGDEQFSVALSEDEQTALNTFMEKFLNAYFRYASGLGSYATVKRYISEDSALLARLEAAQDGLSWAHTTSMKIQSWNINSVTKADASTLLVDVSTVEVTEGAQGGTYDINMKLVLNLSIIGSYEVITMEQY